MDSNSSSANLPVETLDEAMGPMVQTFIYIIYGVIIFLSLVGNVVVILVILRCKSMQSITNIFITNLAVSDLLMSIVAAPFTPIAFLSDTWVLPQIVCKLLSFTMGVSVYVSTLTSTAIAIDRYLVIVHPFCSKMRNWMWLTIIATIWSVSTLICLPLAIHQTTAIDPKLNETICLESWPDPTSRQIYTILSFIFQFVVPSVVISFCYFYVSRLLRNRRHQKIGSRLRNAQKQDLEARRHNKTNRMLIAMVVVFIVCWIPLNAVAIYNDLRSNDPEYEMPHFTAIFVTCHILAMSSAVYNPLLYAWLSETFRRNLRSLTPEWRRKLTAVGERGTTIGPQRNRGIRAPKYCHGATRDKCESQAAFDGAVSGAAVVDIKAEVLPCIHQLESSPEEQNPSLEKEKDGLEGEEEQETENRD